MCRRTSYRCKVVDVPLESKRHAVEWGPVINTTHVSSLHHSFLYGCSPDEYPDLPPTGRVFDCMGKPPCSTFVAMHYTNPDGWADIMHYTNPDGWADIVDSSGVYLKLAPSIPEARQTQAHTSPPQLKDAHIMKAGLVDHSRLIRVPPGMPSWTHANSCPGECTAVVFKNESVKIIGSILHQHNIGRQMYTDVVRAGSKVATINRIDYYDAASQQTLPVLPEFELLPGDAIRTTCVWDSSSRSEVTVGGLSAEDEMCLAYLVYYSAQHQTQEMHSCYTVCGAMDNGTLSTHPTNLNLSTHYICGTGRNPVIPTTQPCSITFGSNQPLSVIHGCPAQLPPPPSPSLLPSFTLLPPPPPSSPLLPPPSPSFPLLPAPPISPSPLHPSTHGPRHHSQPFHLPPSLHHSNPSPSPPSFPLFPPIPPPPHTTTHGRTKESLSAFPLAAISALPQPALPEPAVTQPAAPQLTLPQPTAPQPAAPQSGPLQSAAAATLLPSAAASP
ncbi:unnamed protein product [Closterium sp. Naga37s-1]|nr:unnamed protein product [Closterium sp. Naga37s-1]